MEKENSETDSNSNNKNKNNYHVCGGDDRDHSDDLRDHCDDGCGGVYYYWDYTIVYYYTNRLTFRFSFQLYS